MYYYDSDEVDFSDSGDDEKIQGVKNVNISDEFGFTDSGDDDNIQGDEEYSDEEGGDARSYSPGKSPQNPEYFPKLLPLALNILANINPILVQTEKKKPNGTKRTLIYLRRRRHYCHSHPNGEKDRPTTTTTHTQNQKTQEKFKKKPEGPDRISALPDPLIRQIISLLRMEDAIKTGSIGIRGEWLSISFVSAQVSNSSLKNGALQPPGNSKCGLKFT